MESTQSTTSLVGIMVSIAISNLIFFLYIAPLS
jgi:hypothetical protein